MRTIALNIVHTGIRIVSAGWKPYSRLILAGDSTGWVLDWEMRELRQTATNLDIQTASWIWKHTTTPQALFYASQFFLTDNTKWLNTPHRIGFSYFHGLPNTGEKSFDDIYTKLCRHHERIQRIQVSHSEMRNVLLQTGIDPKKVFLIPIGINLSYFHYQDTELRNRQRTALGIPNGAFVVGSFQKDGSGWGEGMEPKLIKGPDILVETLSKIKASIPKLFVLLTGPARGYVKARLERLGIPYHHLFLKDYPDVGRLFPALDLYLITSRQEGGPKAVLESMASGVPLVTTRVGQAMDLVRHGENAWMVEPEDVNGLIKWALHVYEHQNELDKVLKAGLTTAKANTYAAQLLLWRDFMKGFVE